MTAKNYIYKICSRSEWTAATELGEFTGSEIDLRDGFIHFSAAHQVIETAAKHFAGQSELVLIAVDPDLLGGQLKWEVSRGGEPFPHLYGNLDCTAVEAAVDLPVMPDGTHAFPPDIQ